jgi:hypothetical protein
MRKLPGGSYLLHYEPPGPVAPPAWFFTPVHPQHPNNPNLMVFNDDKGNTYGIFDGQQHQMLLEPTFLFQPDPKKPSLRMVHLGDPHDPRKRFSISGPLQVYSTSGPEIAGYAHRFAERKKLTAALDDGVQRVVTSGIQQTGMPPIFSIVVPPPNDNLEQLTNLLQNRKCTNCPRPSR